MATTQPPAGSGLASGFIARNIEDPRERLVARVAANLFREPNFYSTTDDKRQKLLQDLETVLTTHPEFIVQLAYYTREKLNLRTTANFLLAFSAARKPTKKLLDRYFTAAVRLPTDLLEVVQFLQELSRKQLPEGQCYVPTCLQRLVRHKFREFNIYQLGKYCSEGRRKHMSKKAAPTLTLAMKKLVRLCHICEPADLVCSLLGKRYPETEEEFSTSSLAAMGRVFDPSQAHKRMKIPVPETWETQVSAYGNKAEVWERLIKERKLPFMAMLRNLRNLLEAGVDRETHALVLARLQDPVQVAESRLFPFRFFSAFEALRVNQAALRPGKPLKPKKEPREVPRDLTNQYEAALEAAVKLATVNNVQPILGHSVIFCDVSGSMQTQLSGGPMGSITNCMQVGVLLGLMLRYVCESSEFIVFSSPGRHNKCWFPVELPKDGIRDDILGSMETVLKQGRENLGGGTDFPYDYVTGIINKHTHVDQIFMFSDMMVSPGYEEFMGTQTGGRLSVGSVLDQYRKQVNSGLKFVTVDLACQAKNLLGADYSDDYRNVQLWGYSDAILGLASELQKSQIEAVEEAARELLSKS